MQIQCCSFTLEYASKKNTSYNSMTVSLLHDQDEFRNRLIRELAFHLPGPYMSIRRLALRSVTASKSENALAKESVRTLSRLLSR